MNSSFKYIQQIISLVFVAIFSSIILANSDLDTLARTIHIHHLNQPALAEIPTVSINALVNYLHNLDPHSDYYTEKAYNQQKNQINDTEKLGVIVSKTKNDEFLFIPHENGPAYNSGLQRPTLVEIINAQEAKNLELNELNNLVQSSSELKLKGKDAISDKPVQLIVRPEKFSTPLVERMLYKHAIVLRVNYFIQTKTFLALKNELTKLRNEKIPLILDLRYNSGGDFFAAIDCVSLFYAGNNPVASLQYPDSKLVPFLGRSDIIVYHRPFFIIISELTASAAEVFARALQFYQRAVILGHASEGKCTSQQYFDLPSGDALKLTTAIILGPDGQFCDGQGIAPTLTIDENIHDTQELINRVIGLSD